MASSLSFSGRLEPTIAHFCSSKYQGLHARHGTGLLLQTTVVKASAWALVVNSGLEKGRLTSAAACRVRSVVKRGSTA